MFISQLRFFKLIFLIQWQVPWNSNVLEVNFFKRQRWQANRFCFAWTTMLWKLNANKQLPPDSAPPFLAARCYALLLATSLPVVVSVICRQPAHFALIMVPKNQKSDKGPVRQLQHHCVTMKKEVIEKHGVQQPFFSLRIEPVTTYNFSHKKTCILQSCKSNVLQQVGSSVTN